MAIILRNSYFETGIAAVDEQQRHLFGLLNGVAPLLAKASDTAPGYVGATLDPRLLSNKRFFSNLSHEI